MSLGPASSSWDEFFLDPSGIRIKFLGKIFYNSSDLTIMNYAMLLEHIIQRVFEKLKRMTSTSPEWSRLLAISLTVSII